ncbi:head GIN domain-containing protein [Paraburkholderia megapolitana]|uniref:Putative auto-transporter adhesin, head GIN domain n=1 Tax=Paraburkholderia megapolitana TaxID=420953 RepID=A0A1I3ISQ2_9BURK|nr:head GIN domain-containing protein [Paraburkholderia megapolitana]SFI50907.1 Putative auto-transporter adhesin, head GIN domain [Paraburkholderia megapolitana]
MRVQRIRFSLAALCCVVSSLAVGQENVVVHSDGSAASSGLIVASDTDMVETRRPGKFSGIEVDTSADVSFAVGSDSLVTVTGPANVVPLVKTQVQDGVLRVRLEHSVTMSRPLKVVIVGPTLQAVSIRGSATMKASNLNEDALSIGISGSGTVSASGSVKEVRVAISGSGDVHVSDIHAKTLVASIKGSGNIQAYAADSAVVELSGSGDIKVRGNPAHRIVNRSGSGDVQFD